MIRWEYALLVRRRQMRRATRGWEVTFAWYGPDGSMTDLSDRGDTTLEHLNGAGRLGWELASVTEEHKSSGAVEIHRYHLKRPLSAPPAASVPRQLGRRDSAEAAS
jgi:hypothetical protein